MIFIATSYVTILPFHTVNSLKSVLAIYIPKGKIILLKSSHSPDSIFKVAHWKMIQK